MMRLFLLSLFFTAPLCIPGQSELKTFIPGGYAILDSASGDLNKDGYRDVVLVLKKKTEATQNDVERPLFILHGTGSKKYILAARNDRVVLCASCGGVFGDPYDNIVIKNNYFSVEHYGGSNWRWTRIITFKYDVKRKLYVLHRDAGVSYHTSDPDKTTETVHSKKDFDNLLFTDYNNNAE